MLNFFKNHLLYKKKLHNIFYICPKSSFLSDININHQPSIELTSYLTSQSIKYLIV